MDIDPETLRKAIAGPLGVLFWSVVIALWARRKKSATTDAEKSHRLRQKAYFLGGKVRSLWDRLTQKRASFKPLLHRTKDGYSLRYGPRDNTSAGERPE